MQGKSDQSEIQSNESKQLLNPVSPEKLEGNQTGQKIAIFEDVREEVLKDYTNAKVQRNMNRYLEGLFKQYDVFVADRFGESK